MALYKALDEDFAETDFVFVVFLGADEGPAEAVEVPIALAMGKLVERGVLANTLTLGPDDPGYTEAVDHFGVEAFPSVIALMKGVDGSPVEDEITEDSLLQAYLGLCEPGCAPGCP